ncbi:MAG: dihydroneopterin aldolase [Verrucomicrobiaceae bacterium]
MKTHDTIIIRGLELPVLIGVPAAEREAWQVITADVTLTLCRGFDAMRDELSETVDYEAVANQIKALSAERPRKLLETLAAEITSVMLGNETIKAVEVELRKRILPGVDHVAVKMHRQRE